MHIKFIRGSILPAIFGAIATAAAHAQNPAYVAGDLVLGFQNPGGAQGGDKVVLVRLGDTALTFRDATSNLINIANIGSTLTSTYGASWWEADTLYMSLVGVWGTNNLSTTLQNGDPHRTVYLSRPRGLLTPGTEGTADSTAPSVANSTDATAGAGNAFTVGDSLEVNGTSAVAVLNLDQTSYETQNPFISPGLQGTAYTVYTGGLQDGFEAGTLGSFGGVSNIEGALDLYRIQARNNINGQHGFGGPNFTGGFEGTVVIDQGGQVSFLVAPVPEPSVSMLLGVAACMLGMRARRRSAKS